MPKLIPAINPMAVRVAGAVAIGVAGAAALGGRLYAGNQRFTDVIAGEVAFDAYHKSGDYRLVGVFLLVTGIAYVALGRHSRLRPLENPQPPSGLERLVLVLFPLLAGSTLLLRWMGAEARAITLALPLAAICALAIAMVTAHGLMTADRSVQRACIERIATALLTPAFLFVSLVGVLILLSATLLVSAPRTFIANSAEEITYVFLVSGTVLAFAAATHRVTQETLFLWALRSQVLAPLVFLWPLIGVYEHNGRLFQANVTALARGLGALVVLVSIIASARGAQNRRGRLPSLREAVLPWTVVSVAVIAVSATPPTSAFSLGDDFHTGELAIQWRQYTAFDHEPFRTLVPIPGLIGGFTGGINAVLFAGSATSWPVAMAFTDALLAGLTTAVVIRLVGSLGGLLLSTTMLLSTILFPTNRTPFLLLPLAVLALPGLLARPSLWLIVWLGIATLGTTLASSTGLAITLGTAPIAAWVAVTWIRGVRRRSRAWARGMPTFIAVLLLLIVLSPFLPDVRAMAEFLREGSRSNLPAYGMGMFQFPHVPGLPESLPLALRRSTWEPIRSGAWMVGLPVLVGVLHVAGRRRGLARSTGPTPLAVFGMGLGGFFLASIPYAFGRIDAGRLSRAGLLSPTFFALFLPITLLLARDRIRSGILLVMSLAWGLTLWGVFFPVRPGDLIRHAVEPIRGSSSSAFVDGHEEGLPRLGRGIMEEKTLERLRDLSSVLRSMLRPGETYYDATNRSLHYYASDKRVPTIFSGPFYAADEWSQDRVIAALERDRPPVIWVGPRFFTPPPFLVPNNLRAYRIYRWLLLDEPRYAPLRFGEMEFLVFAERAQRLRSAERLPDPVLLHSLRLGDVGAIPVSWGRSFASLSFRFGPELNLERAADRRPGVAEWTVPAHTGPPHDFMLTEFRCSTGSQTLVRAHVEWDSPDGTRHLFMRGGHGRLLIPLGGDPSWLLYGPTTGTIRLGVPPTAECGDVSFGPTSLLRLQR